MTQNPRTHIPSAPPQRADSLVYLYGVTSLGSAAAAQLRDGRVPGIEPGEPLFPIEAAGLVAAVSRVPSDVFDEEPLNALVTDLERLAPYAVRHEQAVRALAASALVPMTFGAVYRAPGRVTALLEARADEFGALLRRVAGREEWGLKVTGEVPRLLAAADQENDELLRLAAEAAVARPGRAYLISKRREQLRAQAASRLAAAMTGAIVERLAPLAAEVARDDPGPPQPGTEQLLLKAAFLVEAGAATAFCATIADLEREYVPRGLTFEVSGPWAPYSFVRGGGNNRG